MTALTIGITTASDPVCKRGLAVNIAASLARALPGARICVVDADSDALDVTTRLAVAGPYLEQFAQREQPAPAAFARLNDLPLWVLPAAGPDADVAALAIGAALDAARAEFDVVVVDLGRPAPAVGDGWRDAALPLDWVLVAVTPEATPVEAAARFLAELRLAPPRRRDGAPVGVGAVTTGDEGSTGLSGDEVEERLGEAVLGNVRQLWGRAAPNAGFGPALGIGELDEAVAALLGRLGGVDTGVLAGV